MKMTLKNFIEALENRYYDQLEDEFTLGGLAIAVMDTLKVFLED
jgi:hypothetical protein